MLVTWILSAVFVLTSTEAAVPPDVVQDYVNQGGPQRALAHLNCVLDRHLHRSFRTRTTSLGERCNSIESGTNRISINNPNTAVIVDYTALSNHRRFFILNLGGSQNWRVRALFVSHGRYGTTPRSNTQARNDGNTVLKAHLFSNHKGSNASSNGFYITGHRYRGRWSGPDGKRNSLVLHGIERAQNDNACERAVVIHGNSYIREDGPHAGVRRMSSGCYMLDYSYVNEIVDLLRGGGGPHFPHEIKTGGIVFFSYGPRESTLAENHYCGSDWYLN